MAADSINDAIETVAKGMVKTTSDEAQTVERLSIDELIKAEQYRASQTATGKNSFGLRMRKQVPPGTG